MFFDGADFNDKVAGKAAAAYMAVKSFKISSYVSMLCTKLDFIFNCVKT